MYVDMHCTVLQYLGLHMMMRLNKIPVVLTQISQTGHIHKHVMNVSILGHHITLATNNYYISAQGKFLFSHYYFKWKRE